MATERLVEVHVYLLNEGTDVWRPTMAEDLGAGRYRLLATENYDPEDEQWQFRPGEVVSCEPKTFNGGHTALVPVRRVE